MRGILIIILFSLTGCASAPPLPTLGAYELVTARFAISKIEKRTFTSMPSQEAFKKAVDVSATFMRNARQTCLVQGEISKKRCNGKWGLNINEDPEFNAFASGKGNIVLNTGLVGYLQNDSEWAFVIAHELGHHFANHIAEQRRSAYIGELIGGTINAGIYAGIAGVAGVECDPSYENCDYLKDFVREGYEDGAASGRDFAIARYSREQEVEADSIAADILQGAGYNLGEITDLIAFMGSLSKTKSASKFGDSHPSGPERLAQFKLIAFPKTQYSKPVTPKKLRWNESFGLGLGGPSGLYVLNLRENSEAERLGFLRGDEILMAYSQNCSPQNKKLISSKSVYGISGSELLYALTETQKNSLHSFQIYRNRAVISLAECSGDISKMEASGNQEERAEESSKPTVFETPFTGSEPSQSGRGSVITIVDDRLKESSKQIVFEIPSLGLELEDRLISTTVPFVECRGISFDEIGDPDWPDRCPFWAFGASPLGYRVSSILDGKRAEKFKIKIGDIIFAYRQEGFWTSPKIRLDKDSGIEKVKSIKMSKIASLLIERNKKATWVKRGR